MVLIESLQEQQEDDLASQRVLLKNGFTFQLGLIENDLQIHNEWVHTAVFEVRRP